MNKTKIFLLIVALGALGYLIFPILIALFKMAIGLLFIGVIALVWYVARETAKHN